MLTNAGPFCAFLFTKHRHYPNNYSFFHTDNIPHCIANSMFFPNGINVGSGGNSGFVNSYPIASSHLGLITFSHSGETFR